MLNSYISSLVSSCDYHWVFALIFILPDSDSAIQMPWFHDYIYNDCSNVMLNNVFVKKSCYILIVAVRCKQRFSMYMYDDSI